MFKRVQILPLLCFFFSFNAFEVEDNVFGKKARDLNIKHSICEIWSREFFLKIKSPFREMNLMDFLKGSIVDKDKKLKVK